MMEFLCCPPETITTLLISYTLTQNKQMATIAAAASLGASVLASCCAQSVPGVGSPISTLGGMGPV